VFIRLLFMFFATSAFLTTLTMPAFALEVGSRIPDGRDIYYRHYAYTWSDYLHLRADGSYRQITRHHLYVEEKDRGKWAQDLKGDLLLKSDAHYHSIVSGDLRISVWHQDRLQTLPDLKERIRSFLKVNRSDTFPAEEVERIRERAFSDDPKLKIGDISASGVNPVKRNDLEGLLIAIDEFMTSDTKNVFVLKPLAYRSAVIFVDENRVSLTTIVIDQELAQPPHPAHTADKHGYQEIDAATFDEESKDTQPFLFYPGMGELLKRRKEN